jgi:hypothetical protein
MVKPKPAILPIQAVPAVPAAPDPMTALLVRMVDELESIDKTLQPYRTYIAREDALRKQIRAGADSPAKAADAEIRVDGTSAFVILGPRALERAINFKLLVKKIGAAAFSKFAKCGLGDLERHAPGFEITCVSSAHTGSRPLKVFAKTA